MTQYQAMSGDLGPFATSYYDCEFDRENSTYYPGEEVTGKFYLRRFARVPQGLRVRLIGVESVKFGNDFRSYFKVFLVLEGHAPLIQNERDDRECEYSFKFELPLLNLPQTLSHQFGSVEYFVETQLDNQRLSPGQEVYLVHTPQFPGHFKVNPLLDLNLIPELQGPVYLLKDNTGGLSSLFVRNKHPIRFTLNLHKKGFTPGEHIHFTLDVNNSSSRPITSITVKLTQEVKVTGPSSMTFSKAETLEKVVGPSVPAKTTQCWDYVLRVPDDIFITLRGQCVCVTHSLSVTLVTPTFCENVKGTLAITIGTIPIDDFAFLQPPVQQRSNSFTSPSTSLSPRYRPHGTTAFRNVDMNHRHSISSLPTYTSVERGDNESPPPPSYKEATALGSSYF